MVGQGLAADANGSAYKGGKKSVDNWKIILYDYVIRPDSKIKAL
ncbi:hypothetical protein [Paenibacillus sp. USDA918EY]|nr:hypothetical protein [Paenibacillus sp. USDA918EY]